MKNRQLAILLVTLLVIQAFPNYVFLANSYAQTKPDVYIGIDLSYGDVEEAKALIDQVSSYTNLIVVGTTKITWYPNKLTETFQYAYDKGLSFISLTPALPDISVESIPSKNEWFEYANETWGDRLLGFYYLDEPGGRQLDRVQNWIGNASSSISSYADAANQFASVIAQNLGSTERSAYSYKSFTSDYGLYWFDYKAGYDTMFAEFGWNYSRQINVALCRGAATAQNKDWGAMITWTYTTSPYIESDEELYNDLILAYDNGAKYIIVFDGNEGWTGGILTQEHLEALQQFWDYVQSNPRKTNSVSDRTAYVLPNAYGYGFRGPQDHIWGLWEADALSYNISVSVGSLLNIYGEKLDIIYDDNSRLDNSYGYNQLIYWDSYDPTPPAVHVVSPENKTYASGNVSLAFTVNKQADWLGYSLDGQETVTITGNSTLFGLSNGLHNVTVYANDTFGNTGVSETISFRVAVEPEPFPTTLLIAAVVLMAVVGAGLLVYFKKRNH